MLNTEFKSICKLDKIAENKNNGICSVFKWR